MITTSVLCAANDGAPGAWIKAAELPARYRMKYSHAYGGSDGGNTPHTGWGAPKSTLWATNSGNWDLSKPLKTTFGHNCESWAWVWVPLDCLDPEFNELGEVSP